MLRRTIVCGIAVGSDLHSTHPLALHKPFAADLAVFEATTESRLVAISGPIQGVRFAPRAASGFRRLPHLRIHATA
jgi:hypothetical protein